MRTRRGECLLCWRVAFGGPDEDAEEVATPTRRFSLLEITSGLPDDSREADEKGVERLLRELRGRVKAARAVVSATPGLAQTLTTNWQKAARFYVRSGITEAMFRRGGRAEESSSVSDVPDSMPAVPVVSAWEDSGIT